MKYLKGFVLISALSLLVSAAPLRAQVTRQTDCLPPELAQYVAQLHQEFPNGIDMSDPSHSRFSICVPPPTSGSNTEVFQSQVQALVQFNGQVILATAPAACTVVVTFAGQSGNVRHFTNQMTQLDIAGGTLPPGVALRISPNHQSTGKTTITQMTTGQFKITSDFTIWTQITTDGGQTWVDANKPGKVTLTDIGPKKLSFNPKAIAVGQTTSGTVTLDVAAPAGGFTVSLSQSGSGSLGLPASVTIPAGQKTATFAVTGVTAGKVTVKASGPVLSASATVTIK